jgi:hypothetical protein
MEVANTLAYYDTATITDGKSFIVQATCGMICFPIFIKIYLHWHSFSPKMPVTATVVLLTALALATFGDVTH